MNLTLTRDEADRLDADGRVVLIRSGKWCCFHFPPAHDRYVNDYGMTDSPRGEGCTCRPPAEFVEAAKPCETCGGKHPGPTVTSSEHWNCIEFRTVTILCLDGKRRVAAVVPCDQQCDAYPCKRANADCSGGLRTVATVVVEWGSRRLVARADRMEPGALLDVAVVMDHVLSFVTDRGTVATIPHPPDVDPQSLVGQYALGIRKVDR